MKTVTKDFMRGTFTCLMGCGIPKKFSQMKTDTVSSKKTGKCKECHSEYTKNHQLMKRANKYPHQYASCDSCDRTFHKKGRGNNKHLPHELTNCPYCGSLKIGDFQ